MVTYDPSVISAIADEAVKQGVDPNFALSIAHQESRYNQGAVSPTGAKGVMQLEPGTAADMGVNADDLHDNIKGGVAYIKKLASKYNGDPTLTAAAYNAGPGAVDSHGGKVPPYKETQGYVANVVGGGDGGPSVEALQRSLGLASGGAAPPSQAQPPQAGSGPSGNTMAPAPSDEELAKNLGITLAQPGAPAASPKPAAQSGNVTGTAAPGHAGMGAYAAANSALFGMAPILSGAEMAVVNGAQNIGADLGFNQGTGRSMGDTFMATKNAWDQALKQHATDHPFENAAEELGGAAASGPGQLIEHGVQGAAARIAPRMADSALGHIVTHGATGALGGGAYSALSGLEQGDTPGQAVGDFGKGAVAGGVLGSAGGAISEAAPAAFSGLKSPVLRRLAGMGAGAAAGGAIAPMVGVNPMVGAVMGGMSGRELGGLGAPKPKVGIDAADRASALDMVADAGGGHQAAADALEAAQPGHTAPEALGEAGTGLVRTMENASPGSADPIKTQMAMREDQAPGRVADLFHDQTGIDPITAKLDAQDATRQAQQEAKPLWDNALQGNGVWNPEMAEAAQHPLIKNALNQARRLIGPGSDVPNPDVAAGGPGALPESMSVAELRKRMAAGGGPQVGAEVTPDTLMEAVKGLGGNNYAKAANDPMNPASIPTDHTWDTARRILGEGVGRDALGKPIYSTEANAKMEQGSRLSALERTHIPGAAEALDQSGDYLSNRRANEIGEKQFSQAGNKGSMTGPEFAKHFEGLSEGEQKATKQGWLGGLYKKLEAGKLNPEHITGSELHNSVMKTMFGGESAAAIKAGLERETAHAENAAAYGKIKGKAAPEAAPAHHPAMSALAGLATGGVHGALHAVGHGIAKSAIAEAMAGHGKGIPEPVAQALAEHLARDPADLAVRVRARGEELKNVPLHRGPHVLKNLGSAALRGLSFAGLPAANSALAGLH